MFLDKDAVRNICLSVTMQAEQNAIYEENDGGKRSLTWAQTRNMPLTYRVCATSPPQIFQESGTSEQLYI